MFKTKLDELGFTLLTSGLMIYIMGVYNVALHTGGLQYATFGMAAHSFPLEWFIGFLLAFFVASRTSSISRSRWRSRLTAQSSRSCASRPSPCARWSR